MAEIVGGDLPLQPLPAGALRADNRVAVIATDSWLCLDRETVWKEGRKRRTEWRRICQLPVGIIRGVEVQGLSGDRSHGLSLWSGFLGTSRHLPGTSRVLVTTDDGSLVLRCTGVATQVRLQLQPLLRGVAGGEGHTDSDTDGSRSP
jgi:hypothetical protein